MSCKLREFIRNVRAAQTAADERAVVAKECAEIRAAFKDGDSRTRPRNVAKALFISLLGYPTEFAQLECVKLVASSRFGEKRVGYLGLTCLLDEQSEVLLLATNTIKNDLQHPNQYVNGLALTALGNLGTPDMCVAALDSLSRGNPYILKKALLCTSRLVRQGEDVDEKAIAALSAAFRETDHGVQLAACALCLALLEKQPETQAAKLAPLMPDIAKALLSCRLWKAEYRSNEYDVAGVSDPFLHCALMRVASAILQHMSEEEGHPYLSVDLLFIAVNTTSTKNTGNCVLYECARAVMRAKKESVYAAVFKNLGKMLTAGDPNAKYVALGLLQQGVHVDLDAVMERRDVIVECLKDADPSLRRRAVDVIFSLMVRNKHVTGLVKELLNVLLLLGHTDSDFKDLLINKIVAATLSFGVSMQWQLDTLFKIMSVAGQCVDDLVTYSFIEVALGAPQLQSYVVHKIFFALQDPFSNNAALWQERLSCILQAGLYCIGEFGEYLVQPLKKKKKIAGQMVGTAASKAFQVSPKQVASLLVSYADQLLTIPKEQRVVLAQTLVTAAAKLAAKLTSQRETLITLLRRFVTDPDVEVQQRATESIGVLVADEWNDSNIFDRMPFDVGIRKGKEDGAKPPRWYRTFRATGVGCFDPTDVPLVLGGGAGGADDEQQENEEAQDEEEEDEEEEEEEENEEDAVANDQHAKPRQQQKDNAFFLLDADLFIEKRPALDGAAELQGGGGAVSTLSNSTVAAAAGASEAPHRLPDMLNVLDFDSGSSISQNSADVSEAPFERRNGRQLREPEHQNHVTHVANAAGGMAAAGAPASASDLDALSLVFDAPKNSVSSATAAATPAVGDPFVFGAAGAAPLAGVSTTPAAFAVSATSTTTTTTTAHPFSCSTSVAPGAAAAASASAAAGVPAAAAMNARNVPFELADLKGLSMKNNNASSEGLGADILGASNAPVPPPPSVVVPPSGDITVGPSCPTGVNNAFASSALLGGGLNAINAGVCDPFSAALTHDPQHAQQQQQQYQEMHTMNVLNDEAGLSLNLVCMRPRGEGEGASICAEFRNSSSSPLTNLLFEVAVPKYLKLALQPATATTVPPMSSGVVQQQMYVTQANCSSGGPPEKKDKPLAMKCRISYTKGGETLQKCVNVHDFPPLLS